MNRYHFIFIQKGLEIIIVLKNEHNFVQKP